MDACHRELVSDPYSKEPLVYFSFKFYKPSGFFAYLSLLLIRKQTKQLQCPRGTKSIPSHIEIIKRHLMNPTVCVLL